MRFYQVLSCGRIPALVDTDMVLPCADQIPWRDVVVMSKTPEALPGRLVAFYHDRNMEEAQRRCRHVWERYLSFAGFGTALGRQLQREIFVRRSSIMQRIRKLVT